VISVRKVLRRNMSWRGIKVFALTALITLNEWSYFDLKEL